MGLTDVRHVEAVTGVLRAMDYRYGGGVCRDAIISVLSWAEPMLAASADDVVWDRLAVAVGDLHNLAGWTCFDTGRVDAAWHHFDRALTLAQHGHGDSLVANVRYRMGRVHLHHDAPREALQEFGHGESAARTSGSALSASVLSANQAWAYAELGDAAKAVRLLGQAQDEFARADIVTAPPWARFFDETDLSAMIGTVHTELAQAADRSHTRSAIPALTTAFAGYGEDMSRSRAFCLIFLARNHLLDDDTDHAAAVGTQAVELIETLNSTRTTDRIRPLKHEADLRRDNPDARDLSDRITVLLARQQ